VSPTVLRIGGYRFYFFSREEPRTHVHAQHAIGQAKFWLEPVVKLAQNDGLGTAKFQRRFGCLRRMKMKSALRGKPISTVEVGKVAPDGFWLRVDERDLFVPFKQFPWFAAATIRQITAVERPIPHHLRWPDLDVDLALASIEHPEQFPLVSRALPRPSAQPPRRRSRKVSPSARRLARG
jgi:hypothetical protein